MRKPNDIKLCFDCDGVIAKLNKGNYSYAEPHQESIDNINKAYDLGYYIIVYTARYGDRHPGKQWQMGYEETICWLRDHGVKFHELMMGKPAADVYVDDKACLIRGINGNKDWNENFWPLLDKVANRDKYGETVNDI